MDGEEKAKEVLFPVIPACAGALCMTFLLGGFFHGTWTEMALLFLVTAISLYFPIAIAMR